MPRPALGGILTALIVLPLAGGCQRQAATLPGAAGYPPSTQSAPVPAAPFPPDVIVKKEADLPPKDPSPEVCRSYGDFAAIEAAEEPAPARRQQLREQARKAYQQAIRLDPKYVPAYQGLARLEVSMEDYDRALMTYQKAVKIKATDASLWYEMGICYNHKRNWDRALENLAKAVELEPETSKYVDSLGVVLARVGRYQESLDCFTRLGGEAKAHYKLAKTLRRLNQPELSQRHMELALELDPRLGAEPAAPERAPGKDLPSPAPSPVQPVVHMSLQPVPPETPAPTPVQAPGKGDSIESLMARLAAIQAQKAELEKAEQETAALLKEKIKQQKQRLKKMGVGVKKKRQTSPPPPPVATSRG